MQDSDEHTEKLKSITAELRQYVEKRIELASLTISEQVSLVASQSLQQLIGILLIAAGAFFLWFGVAFLVGDLIDNTGLGFVIASLPVLIFGYVFLNRKSSKMTERIQAELMRKVMESVERNLPANQTQTENSLKKDGEES